MSTSSDSEQGIETIQAEVQALEDRGDGQIIAELAAQATAPKTLPTGGVVALTVPAGGEVVLVDMNDPKRTGKPRRKAGKAVVRDGLSFARYVDKHLVRGVTELWADTSQQKLVGVIDAHGDADDAAGWGGHRVELGLIHTPAWLAWSAVDKKMFTQKDFAEFIEQRQADFETPSGTQMLELAQTLEATQQVEFKGAVQLQAGTRTLQYAETSSAKAGQQGQLQIPQTLRVTLRPFYGAERFTIRMFFRYKITAQGLQLGVVLDNPDLVLQAAFESVVDAVRVRLDEDGHEDLPILEGVAPAALA